MNTYLNEALNAHLNETMNVYLEILGVNSLHTGNTI